MSNNGSYSNDKDVEIAVDASSGGFFFSDLKRHDDLKEMLDSKKDSLKLDAMRRIIGMVAKGRDASVLFPAVVKNVVSKNIEVKKLVYVYLERYAEEQQDLALLSIATFQRALKEPNPLIRAGALRVLSSVRVKMISPIVMLAIKDASADMSSYVRKTAAHAIPKLYSLDPELKSELITIIQKLLADKTVLVIGSAVMAFTEVCPERVDLIHRVYRKLCALIVDVDEWGQVVIVNMLTIYARMQFSNPNLCEDENNSQDKPFYDSHSESSEKVEQASDPDHKLLIRSTRPLLQSRNAAVVMAVAQLYNHAAPKSEMQLAVKALVRLLRSHPEVQSVVLNSLVSISIEHKGLFECYLKSFFIHTSDPTTIKLLKLDILTNIISEYNVTPILRELQTYISHSDKKFVAATIQAIGKCACSISIVTDSCLNGLVSLLSNKDEAVVAESVVVIKKLLQTQVADVQEIITHMARLLDSITVAPARAAILWLLGEHSKKVPKIAPDVLRKMAKTFADEHDIVKMQVMNLAIKLYLTNPEQTTVLCQYIFNMARYDQNYDIRDKARFLKQFISNSDNVFTKEAARIFLTAKPAPLLHSNPKGQENFQLGSLSHYIKQRAVGYEPLPDFPEVPPPGDLRNVEPIPKAEVSKVRKGSNKFNENLSWNSETSSKGNSSSSESKSSSSEDSSEEEAESSSEESSEDEESQDKDSSSSDDTSSDEEDSPSESVKESSSKEIIQISKKPTNKVNENTNTNKLKKESNLDLLLDLDDFNETPVLMPSLGGVLISDVSAPKNNSVQVIQPIFVNTEEYELLNKMNGRGLSATYKFTRNPHLFSPNMVNIKLVFINNTQDNITDIRVGKKHTTSGISFHDFVCITNIPPKCSSLATLGIDFNDSAQTAPFEIVSSLGNFNVSIKPFIGELLRPVTMDEELFIKEQSKIKGMNEHTGVIENYNEDIVKTITEYCNVGICKSETPEYSRFAGQTLTSSSLCLITIHRLSVNDSNISVNCSNAIFGSILFNELKKILVH